MYSCQAQGWKIKLADFQTLTQLQIRVCSTVFIYLNIVHPNKIWQALNETKYSPCKTQKMKTNSNFWSLLLAYCIQKGGLIENMIWKHARLILYVS